MIDGTLRAVRGDNDLDRSIDYSARAYYRRIRRLRYMIVKFNLLQSIVRGASALATPDAIDIVLGIYAIFLRLLVCTLALPGMSNAV
jgi:hypothetical protein